VTPLRVPSQHSAFAVSFVLDVIILKCLAKAPEDRFGTAEEMRVALDAITLATYEEANEWWDTFDATPLESDASKANSLASDPAEVVPLALTVDMRDR
jgi:hypothetical protein